MLNTVYLYCPNRVLSARPRASRNTRAQLDNPLSLFQNLFSLLRPPSDQLNSFSIPHQGLQLNPSDFGGRIIIWKFASENIPGLASLHCSIQFVFGASRDKLAA